MPRSIHRIFVKHLLAVRHSGTVGLLNVATNLSKQVLLALLEVLVREYNGLLLLPTRLVEAIDIKSPNEGLQVFVLEILR